MIEPGGPCHGPHTRHRIVTGASALGDAVRVRLGPKSESTVIERAWHGPQVDLEDLEENLGVRLLRETAVRTGDAVGEGTTSKILAHGTFAERVGNVVARAPAVDPRRRLERGVRAAHAATVSAHNDASIGEPVAQARERVGAEGSRRSRRRCDGVEFLAPVASAALRPRGRACALDDALQAFDDAGHDGVHGSAVLEVAP
jgi:hypothetical protein